MRLRSQSARTLLYEEVVEELYRLIDEKHIQPGGKLPPERELIEQLKVSRNVLREAFHVLETRGVIVSHQGKGRFLRNSQATDPRNVQKVSAKIWNAIPCWKLMKSVRFWK